MMMYGTSHFVSLPAAVRDYADYGSDRAQVEQKIAEGQIHIGPPAVKPGERLITIDAGSRYALVTK